MPFNKPSQYVIIKALSKVLPLMLVFTCFTVKIIIKTHYEMHILKLQSI